MDKCKSEKRLKHDVEHLPYVVVDPCDTAEHQETIRDSASLNLMNTLGVNVKPFGLSSRPWLNKNWRWQKRTKPPESTSNKFQDITFNNSTSSIMMRSPNSLTPPNSKKINSCSTGSKRRTIYGGTLASTFSVFLIKCLIVATAYDDKFVNKL